MTRQLGISLIAAALAVSACAGPDPVPLERSAAPTSTQTTAVPETVPETTTTVETTTTAPAAVVAPAPAAGRAAPVAASWTLEPYYGFGAWLDAFDWSVAFARDESHTVGVEAIDHMAAEGVETLYIQASRWNSETDIIEPERLRALIDRAHAHGIAVVGWYLPTFEDPELDLRRLLAIASFGVDGLGVDIESRRVEDVAERNRRLLDLSARLDAALPGLPLAAIVMEPVVMEDVNPNYWPGYPWAQMAPYYDVWMPMSYWTNRRGAWRSAYDYTGVNIARVRAHIGQPDALVHTIGGIGDKTTVGDVQGMVAAAVEHGAIGGSIYDYRTTRPELWDVLRNFRRP